MSTYCVSFHPSHLAPVNPVHYHNRYVSSSYIALWCVFAVPTFSRFHHSGSVWSSFEEPSMRLGWKLPNVWQDPSLKAPGSAFFTTCHCKSIELYYQNTYTNSPLLAFVECICVFTYFCVHGFWVLFVCVVVDIPLTLVTLLKGRQHFYPMQEHLAGAVNKFHY